MKGFQAIDQSMLQGDSPSGSVNNDRTIGELISERCKLSESQLQAIVAHQQASGMRFGEAAVALGFATRDEVLRALSEQFQYDHMVGAYLGESRAELVVASNPFSDEAELFRDLRSLLLVNALAADQPRRALAVVSPNVGEGKSFVAANLAVAFSQLGGRTLLIDADMRTPRQHRLFNIDATTGLSNVLSRRPESNAIYRDKDLPSLYILPVGAVPPNPMELVQRSTFGQLLTELLARFDHIIVDTPAAVHGADASVIASKCGAALIVGRRNHTEMAALQSLLKRLHKSSTCVAGMAMNDY